MKKTMSLLVLATALAGCAYMPSFGDDEDAPPSVAETVAPAPVAIAAHTYEIKKADRGLVRRVKVLLNGRTVETLVFSKTRESSSSYCCTPDGCQEVEAVGACTTFKMTCTSEGACTRVLGEASRL